MKLIVRSTVGEVAALASDHIVRAVAEHPSSILGVATGSSPLPVYSALANRVAAGEVSFGDITAFALDEYVGLPASHDQTYRSVLRREFAAPLGVNLDRIRVPDGAADDPDAAADEFEHEIRASPGVDLQLLGIGANGHLAFNEPGSSFTSRTRVVHLAKETREANARFFGGDVTAVPSRAITQGISTILAARRLLVVATGPCKQRAVANALRGPVSEECPASALRLHEDVTIVLDGAAAAGIEPWLSSSGYETDINAGAT